MRILFNIIIALCLSACGSGESKNSGNSENSASPQQSTQMSDGKSGMPMVNVDEQGVIKGSPIHQSNSSTYYPCEGVISPEFKQVVYALTANLSKGMNVPLPQDSLCAVSQGKPGSIGGMMITAQMYINSSSMKSCIFDNYCNDTRAVMLFPSKEGKILFNTMVINADSKQTMQVCMDENGKILSDKGCASVGASQKSSSNDGSGNSPNESSSRSSSKIAKCNVSNSYGESFKGSCKFTMYEKGSFTIEPSKRGDLILGSDMVSLWITEPGLGEVRGTTPEGGNSRWGEAERSSQNRACWVGSDFRICVN